MISVMIVDFDENETKHKGKSRHGTEKIVFYAAAGVNVSISGHIVGQEQDR